MSRADGCGNMIWTNAEARICKKRSAVHEYVQSINLKDGSSKKTSVARTRRQGFVKDTHRINHSISNDRLIGPIAKVLPVGGMPKTACQSSAPEKCPGASFPPFTSFSTKMSLSEESMNAWLSQKLGQPANLRTDLRNGVKVIHLVQALLREKQQDKKPPPHRENPSNAAQVREARLAALDFAQQFGVRGTWQITLFEESEAAELLNFLNAIRQISEPQPRQQAAQVRHQQFDAQGLRQQMAEQELLVTKNAQEIQDSLPKLRTLLEGGPADPDALKKRTQDISTASDKDLGSAGTRGSSENQGNTQPTSSGTGTAEKPSACQCGRNGENVLRIEGKTGDERARIESSSRGISKRESRT